MNRSAVFDHEAARGVAPSRSRYRSLPAKGHFDRLAGEPRQQPERVVAFDIHQLRLGEDSGFSPLT
jgi:hypothetical protein